jgi:hypothetical protein
MPYELCSDVVGLGFPCLMQFFVHFVVNFVFPPFVGELLLELYTFPEGWRSQVEGLHTLLFLKVFVGSVFRNSVRKDHTMLPVFHALI